MTALRDAAFTRCVEAHSETPVQTAKEQSNSSPCLPERHTRCLLRLDGGDGWCLMLDGHDGECAGYPSKEPAGHNEFGPEDAGKRRWR
jgi:Fe-S-cluster containining protein